MGVRANPGSFRWCIKALSRLQDLTTHKKASGRTRTASFCLNNLYLSIIVAFVFLPTARSHTPSPVNSDFIPAQDAVHITAILGESVVFNCHVEFPGDHPVPYVLQWEKKGQEIPIYIWYESYPTHSGEGYEGRVSRVSPESPFGAASLNLTNIRESDQGWYECKVVFLNRSPNQHKNGTWFHLDVHAPPRFSVTPEDIIYVNLGDSIILNCQADGTPTPEILWYKDTNPVEPSSTVGIFNDGTELRISTIRNEDIGDYTCIARNGEGQVSHTARVIIAGGAVIMVPPTNQTKLEGEKAQFTCEAKAMPGNVTVRWFREGALVKEVAALETRITVRKDGSLIINPVSADDSGQYTCEVSNGIGDPQSATAYLNVEYPAKVTFTPTVQYLPFRLAGIVECYIKSNPPLQYVTWTKDKRLLEPYQEKDVVIMNNGSLLFTRVNQNHQGRYTCTPYNAQGTQGSSGPMEVLVRKPPAFTVEPEPLYQKKLGESVEMPCHAQEAEGTAKPTVKWERRDGSVIPLKNRAKIHGGNLTIDSLRRSDFGFYQCIASNEVATIVSATQLVIEGTQPHAPYNLTLKASEFSVSISWLPGYSGGPDYKQEYTVFHREGGKDEWVQVPVQPPGSTSVTVNALKPGVQYEFKVVGKNALGNGLMSDPVAIRTLEIVTYPTSANSFNYTFYPPQFYDPGPKPGQPRNVTVTEIPNGFLITWQTPAERANLVLYYTIKYRTDAQWKTLNRGKISAEDTHYLVKNLVGGRTYYFRVLANSAKSYESSEEVKFPVPARVKHKAITAGVVGGILFFIVAIILSVCAVKICNKRKRRKQEKELNMVACRTSDLRNSAASLGVGVGPVPIKPCKKTGVPGLNFLLSLFEALRSNSVCSKYIFIFSNRSNHGKKRRDFRKRGSSTGKDTVDGVESGFEVCKRNSLLSDYSSSDDGGFLPRKRRPIVSYPSQLSFQSFANSDQSTYSRLLRRFNLLRPRPQDPGLYKNVASPEMSLGIYVNTPVRAHSSPAGAVASPPYFSDLSSVHPGSSAEKSSFGRRPYVDRYFHTLPRLHAISEDDDTRFVPVHVPRMTPDEGPFYQNYPLPHEFRSRHLPISRSKRSLPDSFPLLNIAHHFGDAPSDSSGFGSKNTSSQLQSSSHSSGLTDGLRLLPPSYRPPPPPSSVRYASSPPSMSHWLDLITRLRASNDPKRKWTKELDVGSVDGHYEFDPSTPSICTPTGLEFTESLFTRKRSLRFDNIDARVQAMKEEFNAWRQSQEQHKSVQSVSTPPNVTAKLETVC